MKGRRLVIARLSLALLLTAGACHRAPQVVVIDGWWSADYARNACESAKSNLAGDAELISRFGCEQVTSCPELTRVATACVLDPRAEVLEFELQIVKQFAMNSDCQSVAIFSFSDPKTATDATRHALASPHWTLGLDYQPGAKSQPWWLGDSRKNTHFFDGNGSPADIAGEVCALAARRGATVGS